MQHLSDCDGSAIFRISSKQIANCTNSYQDRMQFDLFRTSSKLLRTDTKKERWGSHVLRMLSKIAKKRWGSHIPRVLPKMKCCALAPDLFTINFRLPYVDNKLLYMLTIFVAYLKYFKIWDLTMSIVPIKT
jgi:hypothetical protein